MATESSAALCPALLSRNSEHQGLSAVGFAGFLLPFTVAEVVSCQSGSVLSSSEKTGYFNNVCKVISTALKLLNL